MSRELPILIGEEECMAELLVAEAPRTCRLIENALPLTGILSHAGVG